MNPEMSNPPWDRPVPGGLLFPGYCLKRMSLRASAHTGVALSKDSLRSQSVSPWLPLWGSCHEVTERANTPSLPLAGHLSHGERQGPHPSRLRRATFPMGEGFSPGLVHRYKNRIQKLCVLHRKSCVLGRNHPILHFDEKRIAIAAPFVYNVCIAVPGTQAKSYGSTVFPKGVFDHYVYC